MSPARLTEAQKRVMKSHGHGWEGRPGAGSSIVVNGARICNVDTMNALQRARLVVSDESRCLRATPEGKSRTAQLGL